MVSFQSEVPPVQLDTWFSLCAAQVLAGECRVAPVSRDSVPAQLSQPAPMDPPQCTTKLISNDHRSTNCEKKPLKSSDPYPRQWSDTSATRTDCSEPCPTSHHESLQRWGIYHLSEKPVPLFSTLIWKTPSLYLVKIYFLSFKTITSCSIPTGPAERRCSMCWIWEFPAAHNKDHGKAAGIYSPWRFRVEQRHICSIWRAPGE